MVGDYISTSFVAPGHAVGVFAIGFPMNGSLFNEPMFAGLEKVRTGTNRAATTPAATTGTANTVTTAF